MSDLTSPTELDGEQADESLPKWFLEAAAGLAIFVAAVVVYLPAVNGEMLWHDRNYISDTPTSETTELILSGRRGLRDIWLTGKAMEYFPLTNSVFWLEWRLWSKEDGGFSREGYHLVSILFHALAAVVIWRVLIRLGVPWAWLGGMLSAVHPVTVPSVAWLSELKNCLSIFLYSLWILAWLRYDDRPTSSGYVLALALFAMGMLAKASGVALPATIVILAWWRRGRVTWDDLRRTVPFFAFALAIGLIAIWAERAHSLGLSNSRPEGLASRIAAIGWIVWFYYLKDIVPTGLAMVYPRWAISPTDILSWAPLAGLIALGVAAWRFRASWGRPILALLSYTLVALVPVLGLAAMSYHDHSLVSDHFQYLVLPAVMGLVAGTLGWSARRWGGGAKPAGYVLAGACVLACLAATWHRAGVFSTSESFWAETFAVNPNAWMGHYNMGVTYQDRGEKGDSDRAIAEFEQAIRLRPSWADSYDGLGAIWLARGDYAKAVSCFREAIAHRPRFAGAHNNMGIALAKQRQFAEAIASFQRAREIDPHMPGVAENIARLEEALGSTPRADRP